MGTGAAAITLTATVSISLSPFLALTSLVRTIPSITSLSQLRVRIENAFALLVGRWGIFWRPLRVQLKNQPKLIYAISKLHNFCIDEGDVIEEESGKKKGDEEESEKENGDDGESGEEEIDEGDGVAGWIKNKEWCDSAVAARIKNTEWCTNYCINFTLPLLGKLYANVLPT